MCTGKGYKRASPRLVSVCRRYQASHPGNLHADQILELRSSRGFTGYNNKSTPAYVGVKGIEAVDILAESWPVNASISPLYPVV